MSNHTPGPWIDSGYINFDGHRIIVARTTSDASGPHGLGGSGRRWIAMVNPAKPEEQEANARILAAAPELLAALDLAERIMSRDGIQALRGLAWTDNELETIRAALMKAGGKVSDR